jgi:hypothetical protein
MTGEGYLLEGLSDPTRKTPENGTQPTEHTPIDPFPFTRGNCHPLATGCYALLCASVGMLDTLSQQSTPRKEADLSL